MIARCVVALMFGSLLLTPHAAAAPRKKKPAATQPDDRKKAERHFKSGVALFDEGKFGEALAEFERAYEVEPHPVVLYNIAGCHRALSQYGEAVKFYRRFLDEENGRVPAKTLTAARSELDGILARIARVSIAIAPEGATLYVDGVELGTLVEMPLVLPPGEHRLTAKADGRKEATRVIRVASGDELTVDLTLPELPAQQPQRGQSPGEPRSRKRAPRVGVGAAFGTNLLRAEETGAPSLALNVALGRRFEIGLDAVLIAYAAMPSFRLRLAGDALAVHAIAALPISVATQDGDQTFVAGAAGLGLRYRATPAVALRLETLASFAGGGHGTTVPTFVGGEVWF